MNIMNLPEKSLLITRGVFGIATFSLVPFYFGPLEGILVTLVLIIMLSSLVRRSELQHTS